MTTKSLYDVLGVSVSATAPEIKGAYRRLAMKHHPDRNAGAQQQKAEALFKEVKDAYETLSDDARRAAYDRSRRPVEPPHVYASASSFNSTFDHSDFFEDLMRTTGTTGSAKATGSTPLPSGDDIEMSIEITMEEAWVGGVREMKVHRAITCPRCYGQRADCPRCAGVGQVFEDRYWEFTVPPHARDGLRLRLKHAGHSGPRFSSPGHLYITVQWAVHPVWTLTDDGDLARFVRLTEKQAQDGVTLKIRTIDGATGTVSVPAGSSEGRRLRLNGKGWPQADGSMSDALLILVITDKASDVDVDEREEDQRRTWKWWNLRGRQS